MHAIVSTVCGQRRLWANWEDAQAGLGLRCPKRLIFAWRGPNDVIRSTELRWMIFIKPPKWTVSIASIKELTIYFWSTSVIVKYEEYLSRESCPAIITSTVSSENPSDIWWVNNLTRDMQKSTFINMWTTKAEPVLFYLCSLVELVVG